MYIVELNLSQLDALRDALDRAYDMACTWGEEDFIAELDEVYIAMKSVKESEAK